MVVAMYENAKKTKSNFTFGNGNSLYACNIGVGNCTDYHSYFILSDNKYRIAILIATPFST